MTASMQKTAWLPVAQVCEIIGIAASIRCTVCTAIRMQALHMLCISRIQSAVRVCCKQEREQWPGRIETYGKTFFSLLISANRSIINLPYINSMEPLSAWPQYPATCAPKLCPTIEIVFIRDSGIEPINSAIYRPTVCVCFNDAVA